jgi:hypothetical protein
MNEQEQSLSLGIAMLIQAMHNQTQAISRLAASNESLVRAMAEADGSDPGDLPAHQMRGLDGRPL